MTLHEEMMALGRKAKQAAVDLAAASSNQKNQALQAMAKAIEESQQRILDANAKDVERAKTQGLTDAMIDRLRLDPDRIAAIVTALQSIAKMGDPVGRILAEWTAPSGLHIKRVAIPLGVIGVIYESRPNVTADAAALCLKAGNTVILRGGSESQQSNRTIVDCLHIGLQRAQLPIDAKTRSRRYLTGHA
jgi:glutamate-5-semialdehyde dehydrogenase